MRFTVNQEERDGTEGLTISQLVTAETGMADGRGVAVAINHAVLPRSQWEKKTISEGDNVDVLIAVQGG